jgi:(2Fe-2S) ferredoxin
MRPARTHVLVAVDEETRLAGVEQVLSALRAALDRHGLAEEVQVVETGTLGVSGQGVVLAVYPDGVFYGRVRPEDVDEIVEVHLLKGRPVERLRLPTAAPVARPGEILGRQTRVVLRNVGVINPENIEEYIAQGGYEALAKVLFGMKPEEVIEEVRRSGLRGRGGAGFPTGLKWAAVRSAPGPEKYVICNADEGEPGTFKDRLILEGDPHRILEAMIIAGYAVGAKLGIIYVRGEYCSFHPPPDESHRTGPDVWAFGRKHFGKRLFLRYRGPAGRRRVRLRRGDSPHRVLGGKARLAQDPPALPSHLRPLG